MITTMNRTSMGYKSKSGQIFKSLEEAIERDQEEVIRKALSSFRCSFGTYIHEGVFRKVWELCRVELERLEAEKQNASV